VFSIDSYEAVLLTLVALALYFVPVAVARWRGHRRLVRIAALNIALGWTGFGWVAALVWGLSGHDLSRIPLADANVTRRERIADFRKYNAWRPASRSDAAPGREARTRGASQ